MPRLPKLSAADVGAEYQPIIARNLNLHRITLHSPKTAQASVNMGRYIRYDCTLDPRLREMAIIQATYCARSAYEYTHHLKIAEDFGVPKADLHAIADDTAGRPTHLDALTRAALKAAREMAVSEVSDETFAELQKDLSNEHIVDLIFCIGFYCGFVRITGSLQIDVEPEYMPYLEEYPLPQG